MCSVDKVQYINKIHQNIKYYFCVKIYFLNGFLSCQRHERKPSRQLYGTLNPLNSMTFINELHGLHELYIANGDI